jgi:hypothetical protein
MVKLAYSPTKKQLLAFQTGNYWAMHLTCSAPRQSRGAPFVRLGDEDDLSNPAFFRFWVGISDV